MIYHTPDTSFKRLRSLYRRAKAHAKPGTYKNHPLEAAWSNTVMFMGAGYYSAPCPDEEGSYPAIEIETQERALNWSALDWFAERVERFTKDNIVKDDQGFAAICHEVMATFQANPEPLVNHG